MHLGLLRAEMADMPHGANVYFTALKSSLVLRLKPDTLQVREGYMGSDMNEPHVFAAMNQRDKNASTMMSMDFHLASAQAGSGKYGMERGHMRSCLTRNTASPH
jgi:hypothetical protein